MENLIFLFHFLRLTLLHYIYPNPRLSFHFFILFWLLCAFYYCKSLLPTIGRLDARVPPGSVLLYSTVKLAPYITAKMHLFSRYVKYVQLVCQMLLSGLGFQKMHHFLVVQANKLNAKYRREGKVVHVFFCFRHWGSRSS